MKPHEVNGMNTLWIVIPATSTSFWTIWDPPECIGPVKIKLLLRQLHVEASFYGLAGLMSVIENKANIEGSLWEE